MGNTIRHFENIVLLSQEIIGTLMQILVDTKKLMEKVLSGTTHSMCNMKKTTAEPKK